QHARAQAVLFVRSGEDVIVYAAFAAIPELFVVCEFGEGNGAVTEVRVDFHHCQTGSKAKQLGARIHFARQLKGLFLNFVSQTELAKFGHYDEPGVGHKLFICPGFYIAKASKLILIAHRYDGFAFSHFLSDVLRRSLGNTSTSCFGRFFYLPAYFINKNKMFFRSYSNLKFCHGKRENVVKVKNKYSDMQSCRMDNGNLFSPSGPAPECFGNYEI